MAGELRKARCGEARRHEKHLSSKSAIWSSLGPAQVYLEFLIYAGSIIEIEYFQHEKTTTSTDHFVGFVMFCILVL